MRRRRALRVLVGAAVVAASVFVVLKTLRGTAPASACAVTSASGATYTLSPVQAQNASIITAVAFRKGLPDHAVTVALAAALQESKLVNLDHGDLDSLGLFQQRPSQGWGTPAQIMDPSHAAAAFYDRLVAVANWQSLTVGQVAQAVQLSAVPGGYAPWESEARALARALTGEAPAVFSCRLTGWAGTVPPSGVLAAAAQTEFGADVIGRSLDAKTGWEVASWAVAHAFEYHLRGVTFGGRTWTPAAETWTVGPGSGSDVTVRT